MRIRTVLLFSLGLVILGACLLDYGIIATGSALLCSGAVAAIMAPMIADP